MEEPTEPSGKACIKWQLRDQLSADILKGAVLPPSALSVDDIKLGRKLGNGAFGDVWSGDLRGNPVAVKMITKEKASPAAARSSLVVAPVGGRMCTRASARLAASFAY